MRIADQKIKSVAFSVMYLLRHREKDKSHRIEHQQSIYSADS
jgi:hypothetical protein